MLNESLEFFGREWSLHRKSKSPTCCAVAASQAQAIDGGHAVADAAARVPVVQECAVGNTADASTVARAQAPQLLANAPLPSSFITAPPTGPSLPPIGFLHGAPPSPAVPPPPPSPGDILHSQVVTVLLMALLQEQRCGAIHDDLMYLLDMLLENQSCSHKRLQVGRLGSGHKERSMCLQ